MKEIGKLYKHLKFGALDVFCGFERGRGSGVTRKLATSESKELAIVNLRPNYAPIQNYSKTSEFSIPGRLLTQNCSV